MLPEAENIEEVSKSELAGENGEVYLFQWLSSTEKKLKNVPIVRICQWWPNLLTELF